MLKLNKDNYYTDAANADYMSVSQYKDFAGSLGHGACEYQAMAKLKGKWREEPSQAMLIGMLTLTLKGHLTSSGRTTKRFSRRMELLKRNTSRQNKLSAELIETITSLGLWQVRSKRL